MQRWMRVGGELDVEDLQRGLKPFTESDILEHRSLCLCFIHNLSRFVVKIW